MKNILKWFKKEKPVYTFPEYADTDPAKPPIGPPLEEWMCSGFGEYETEFSKQRSAAWDAYMKQREERRLEAARKENHDKWCGYENNRRY